jgi:transcriptional regulator with XRE-family HTH domain
MAGRPRVLDAEGEATLDALLEAGLDQASAARAVGCSTRTVQRFEARRRATPDPPQSLDALLDSFPSIEDTLAELEAAPLAKPMSRPRGRRRRARPEWRESARRLEELYTERWAPRSSAR